MQTTVERSGGGSMKYRFRTRPYAHQVEGIRFAFKQFNQGLGAALLMEPRCGKTKTSIDIACILRMKYGVRKVVVICPSRVMSTWVSEFHTHSPMIVETKVWDAKERKRGAIPQPGSAYDLSVLLTNFEAFATPGHRTPSGRSSRASGRFKHRKLIQDWVAGEDSLLVVDESHRIKNPSGKWSNMIVSMRSMFTYRLILTGTPITKAKRAADIYMQWQLVNPDRFSSWGATYQDFREHTGRWITNNGFPQWVGPKKRGLADLQRGIHQDGLVIRRADCFDLPERLPDRIVDVPLTKSAQAYDDMARDMVAKLESGDIAEAAIPLVVTLRLSQITSGFVGIQEPHPTNPDKLVSRPVRVGTEKLSALEELFTEETLEVEEPVVVVARWKADIRAVQRLCTRLKMPVHTIQGGQPRSATDDALRAFKRAAGTPTVMVVQPQAGGVGIDMSTSSHMIWMSLTPSYVDWAQMNDRIALANHGVRYTYLLAPGTVDHLVYESLQTDTSVSREILTHPKKLLRSS